MKKQVASKYKLFKSFGGNKQCDITENKGGKTPFKGWSEKDPVRRCHLS